MTELRRMMDDNKVMDEGRMGMINDLGSYIFMRFNFIIGFIIYDECRIHNLVNCII